MKEAANQRRPLLLLRLPGAFQDVAENNFREPQNQFSEARNLLTTAFQFALFVCQARLRVAATFHRNRSARARAIDAELATA